MESSQNEAMEERQVAHITTAASKDGSVVAVAAAFSGKFSRMFLWSPSEKSLTAGQMLKGHAMIQDLSPDSRYVSYSVIAYANRAQAWVAISKPPYFTALAFFPTDPYQGIGGWAVFEGSERVRVMSNRRDLPWIKGFDAIQERIEPGCPFEIVREPYDWDVWPDKHEMDVQLVEKLSAALGSSNTSIKDGRIEMTLIRPPFEQVPTPDWAKTWS